MEAEEWVRLSQGRETLEALTVEVHLPGEMRREEKGCHRGWLQLSKVLSHQGEAEPLKAGTTNHMDT